MILKRRRVIHFHVTRDDTAVWVESKHPRKGSGPGGGQFTSGAGGAGAAETHIHVHQPPQAIRQKVLAKPEPKVQGREFNAHRYAQSQDDPDITEEKVFGALTPEKRAELDKVMAEGKKRGETIHMKENKRWPEHRMKAQNRSLVHGKHGPHDEDYSKTKWWEPVIGPEQIRRATPAPGEKPTFTMLGGRGGSGKSWFKGKRFDPNKVILLDADHIKHMIDEFQGWNANEVHEESSEMLERVLDLARKRGLHVVLDATMKSSPGVMQKAREFKGAGYKTRGFYMHLPRAVAAARAIGRYFSPGEAKDASGKVINPNARGRYVPPGVVLGNRLNEDNFDKVRPMLDEWEFYDNNVPRGTEPRLIAKGSR